MTPFRTERLANGVVVDFVELSNRYFGDYHRVCVAVRIHVPLPGDCRHRIKHLERMGVAGADVAAVRDRLVDDYWRHAGPYLAHPDFPTRLSACVDPSDRSGATCYGHHAD